MSEPDLEQAAVSSLPIYIFQGMTPEESLLRELASRLPAARIIPWIEPLYGESLADYAVRLVEPLGQLCCLVGVSFGGIVALEAARLLHPKVCILISSIGHPRELPPWFRAWGWLPAFLNRAALRLVGQVAHAWPRKRRNRTTIRLLKLGGATGNWYRWATTAVLAWQPQPWNSEIRLVRIHGDRDTTFPLRYLHPDVVIPGGGHHLAGTHAPQVAEVISSTVQTLIARQSK